MSNFRNFFSPSEYSSKYHTGVATVQGTTFHGDDVVAGYLDGQFVRGRVDKAAEMKVYDSPVVMDSKRVELAIDVMTGQRRGVQQA